MYIFALTDHIPVILASCPLESPLARSRAIRLTHLFQGGTTEPCFFAVVNIGI